MSKSNMKCTRCGTAEHYVIDCYAAIDVSGNAIIHENGYEEEEERCEHCDAAFATVEDCHAHEKTCKAKKVQRRYVKKTPDRKEVVCHICGTTGHLATGCPMTRFIDKD